MSEAAGPISRVAIVDDEPRARAGYEYLIEDAQIEALPLVGPLGSLGAFSANDTIPADADAALCDFELGTRAYASFTGAELVAHWYASSFPAVLCTRYEKVDIERIRPYRRWIPVLIKPDELNLETMMGGFNRCIQELSGKFSPDRRPWRTQVHFLHEDVEQAGKFIIELPGWENQEVIRVKPSDLPIEISDLIREDFRCHAHVNLGAETSEDLFLCDWEVP